MRIATTRFGLIDIEAEEVIHFPAGLFGFESCREWVLFSDSHNDALGWLQCTTRPEIALAVVSPRRFVADYQLRVLRSELVSLGLEASERPQILAIVSKHDGAITLNLKAPLVVNLRKRIGRQVVGNGEHALQYAMTAEVVPLKRSA